MTPKEKAKELVSKFSLNPEQPFYILSPNHIKNSALIAVDQMMLVLPFTDKNKSLNEYAIQMQKYLEQVRHEIKNL